MCFIDCNNVIRVEYSKIKGFLTSSISSQEEASRVGLVLVLLFLIEKWIESIQIMCQQIGDTDSPWRKNFKATTALVC